MQPLRTLTLSFSASTGCRTAQTSWQDQLEPDHRTDGRKKDRNIGTRSLSHAGRQRGQDERGGSIGKGTGRGESPEQLTSRAPSSSRHHVRLDGPQFPLARAAVRVASGQRPSAAPHSNAAQLAPD